MDYIIRTEEGAYFCGWDNFGQMKFVPERRLAYRMRRPVAVTTLEKISKYQECFLERLA